MQAQPPFSLTPRVLENPWVRLEPLTAAHREEIRAAVDCDPETWQYLMVNAVGDAFPSYWNTLFGRSQSGERITYAIRARTGGRVVGTSSFLHADWSNRGIEIGATFIHPDARAGAANPASKLTLLGEAFGAGALRVEIITDVRNARSAAAIAKLGAKHEGILRSHRITWTGHVRDTTMFSIIAGEWPEVKAGLEARLAAFAQT